MAGNTSSAAGASTNRWGSDASVSYGVSTVTEDQPARRTLESLPRGREHHGDDQRRDHRRQQSLVVEPDAEQQGQALHDSHIRQGDHHGEAGVYHRLDQ